MTKSMFRVLGVVASMAGGGAASAADAPAVEWKVSNGGNGHWYQGVVGSISWNNARIAAIARGGDLASIETLNEHNFIVSKIFSQKPSLFSNSWGPHIGGIQADGATEPSGGWSWVSGSALDCSIGLCDMDNNSDAQNRLAYDTTGEIFAFNDVAPTQTDNTPSYLIEYSADCNGDGSVDYGQIQSGELADTNNNGVPDVCEPHVTYVQPISGPASGGTAVNINGINFPNSVSVLFGGVAATDVIVVSPTLITAVTPVGVPGMTVVTVNGVGGEAFYYRSNCQSDLDGSGQVDSSDLSILLLDFGSCGDSAAVAPQQSEPLILQSVETTTPVLNKK